MLKWFVTVAWTDANFCRLRIRRNRSIARSRRRNGRCEFSARLFNRNVLLSRLCSTCWTEDCRTRDARVSARRDPRGDLQGDRLAAPLRRAALSGLRKAGATIEREAPVVGKGGGSVCRITATSEVDA
jgi:hypothetical protein